MVFPSLSEFPRVCCDPHSQNVIVNKAEIDVFLEVSCFVDDPADVGNLISGSSASSFFFFLISWRLITLQYSRVFCHTLK